MDLTNFVNNLREGVQKGDQFAINTANQLGQLFQNTWNTNMAPFQSLGNTINNEVQKGANFLGNAANSGWNALTQNVAAPLEQAQSNLANTVNSAFGINNAQTNANTAQGQQTAAPTTNQGQTYYYRDPAIDNFVNVLRFITNPIRGITGWTPLDIAADNTSDILYGSFGKKYIPEEVKAEETKTEETKTEEPAKTEDTEDVVLYTYKPGDTFGQVIKDLGLGTAKGLWGTGGDVEYYTQQLYDQGALNRYGNIPIGTTIKLKRRK